MDNTTRKHPTQGATPRPEIRRSTNKLKREGKPARP
jgi:hypothetical protein